MKSPDILVAGGGIIGGAIAFDLARRGLRVAVLDRQEPMREASWAAAGMLSPAPHQPADIPLVPLARYSLELYPEFVEAVEEASGLRAGFRQDGAIELIFRGDPERELSTLVAMHRGLGLACEPLPLDEAEKMEPLVSREASAAAFLPEECSVEPRALAAAVLAAAQAEGVEFRAGTLVRSLELEGAKCAGLKTAAGETLGAAHVVIAAGCWSSQIAGAAACAPTSPVRGQMAALRHRGRPLRHVVRSGGGYLVPRGGESPQMIVVGSTIEHAGYEKRVTSGGIEKILAAANELAPELENAEVTETWSGLRPGTPDQMPIIGPGEIDGLVFATGHYRNGILLAPVTAKLIGEWISDRRTSFDASPFSPLRFAGQSRPSMASPAF